MTFNLSESYRIMCNEKCDDQDLYETWDATLLVSDEGKVIGMTNGDNKQLIVGYYSNKDGIEIELYRFFEPNGRVYLYHFPSEYSTEEDFYGTFSVFVHNGLGGLGDCYFNFEKYVGDYKEITDLYVDTIARAKKDNDTLKLSVINQVFNPNVNEQDSDKSITQK